MNIKNVLILMLSLIAILGLVSSVSAVGVDVQWLKIDGDEVSLASGFDENLNVDRGQDLPIKLKLFANEDVDDVQVYAMLSGYEYSTQESSLINDFTDVIDMDENDTESFNLNLEVPDKMDKDYYYLRILVMDRTGTVGVYEYSLHVKGVDRSDAVIIKDHSFSPSTNLYAGRAMTAKVRVKNMGDKNLDDVKVIVSIPELDVKDTETLDELDADESETFEELLLRIPSDAEAGDYTVIIQVEFDEYESNIVTDEITVKATEADTPVVQEQASVINVPNKMDLVNAGASFPITIENRGYADAVYSLDVNGITWGQYAFDPAADVIVPAGSTKTIYLHIKADNVDAGEKFFRLEIISGTEKAEQVLSVNVAEEENTTNIRNALEIGLIILVVILIIIGLIIGFSKLKDNNREDDEAETYY